MKRCNSGLRRDFFKRLAELLALSIILEASGYPKPGNVHRLSDRKGLRYEAFLATGIFSLKYFERGIRRGYYGFKRLILGDLVYGLVRDVIEKLKSTNTCLGSSLLLSLMSVSIGKMSREEVYNVEALKYTSREIMEYTTVWDAIYYYKAIRKAAPSYIKPTDETGVYINVWDPRYKRQLLSKQHRLLDILKYSSRFDIIAREALSGFKQGFQAERFLRDRLKVHHDFNRAIVETYLYLLSRNRDTVVFLKHGPRIANYVSIKAKKVLENIIKRENDWKNVVQEFDNELVRLVVNPGSVADIVAETIALYLFRNMFEGGVLLDLSF